MCIVHSPTQTSFINTQNADTIIPILPFFLPPVNPMFIDPMPDDQTVNETESVAFTCTAAGIPAPTITFYMGSTLLDGVGTAEPNPRVTLGDHSTPISFMDNGEEIMQVNRTLTINNTMDADSGSYECRANTAFTPVEDQVFFELVVQSKLFLIIWGSKGPPSLIPRTENEAKGPPFSALILMQMCGRH